jgi:hypothetical protein
MLVQVSGPAVVGDGDVAVDVLLPHAALIATTHARPIRVIALMGA